MAKKSVFDQFSYEEPEKTDPLDQVLAPKAVPTIFPSVSSLPYRIAIIGEFPGAADLHHGIPFCPQGTPDYPYAGSAGRELNKRLSQAGIIREGCLLSHLTTPTLEDDLKRFVPHLTLLLGKDCLVAAKAEKKLEAWRGSLFISDIPGPFFGLKCLASFSPWDCLRQYDWMPLLAFDIRKAKLHGTSSNLTPPYRDLRVGLSVGQTLEELTKIKESKPTIAIDIEGYVDAMSCISIAPSPDYAFIIPLATRGNNNYYDSLEDEISIWRALSSILEDPIIPKVLQNSLYDRFVLQYSYKIVVRGVIDDTMLRHSELYSELPKALSFQASIYTDEPYWKHESK